MADDPVELAIKIVMLGESGVGKTNLLLRYLKDTFESNQVPTIGMDFHSKEIRMEGNIVKAQFWDTAGQEKYRSIARQYFKAAHGVLLVYDTSTRESFAKTRSWLEQITENGEKEISVMLVGNKIDKLEDREVPTNEGKKFAKDNGLFFWETSALTNEDNCVHEAFTTLITECYKKALAQYNVALSKVEQEREDAIINGRVNQTIDIDIPAYSDQKRQGCCGQG